MPLLVAVKQAGAPAGKGESGETKRGIAKVTGLRSKEPIRVVAPVEMPLPTAMIRKNSGNDKETAATAWVESCPAYQVSTTLNMVLKKKPMPTGRASRRTSGPTGLVRMSEEVRGHLA